MGSLFSFFQFGYGWNLLKSSQLMYLVWCNELIYKKNLLGAVFDDDFWGFANTLTFVNFVGFFAGLFLVGNAVRLAKK